MADLGAIGEGLIDSEVLLHRWLYADGVKMSVGISRKATEGNPTPSMEMGQPGMFPFRWNISAGVNRISVSVKCAEDSAPYPTLTVKANPSIGVNSDVVGTAGVGVDWKTIGPVEVTATDPGVVWVELAYENHGTIPPTPCYWDNLVAT